MANFSLIPFAKETAPNITIETEFNSSSESIFISFRIKKGVDLIDLGHPTPNKERLIKLWEKTCFECFIRNSADQYVEFNFSPNFEWNCFYFEKKGNPLTELSSMLRPETEILLSADHFFIFVDIKKEFFPKNFFDNNGQLSVGLTSVIKEKTGRLSYWALSHADSKPNFHHFDSFKYKF